MTTKIIIVRHGNTFTSDQTPTRVGGRTDLELVEDQRARAAGIWMKQNNIQPDVVFAAPLKRTSQTAAYICEELDINPDSIIKDESFVEVDYGPDENKTEDEVMTRLGNGDLEKGKAIIDEWNANATVPEGWKVDIQACINAWEDIAKLAETEYKGKTILIVSSNGIIRFAPYITGDFEAFAKEYKIKVTTGGLCSFEKSDEDKNWKCTNWNVKCKKIIDEQNA